MLKKIFSLIFLILCNESQLHGYKHSYTNNTDENISLTTIYGADTGIDQTSLNSGTCRRDYRNLAPKQKAEIDTGPCLIDEVFVINEHNKFLALPEAFSFLPAKKAEKLMTLNAMLLYASDSGKKIGRWRSLGNKATPSKTFQISKDKNGNFKLSW